LFVTPGSTEHSKAEDPRSKEGTAKAAAKKKSGKTLPEIIREYALSFPETHEDQPWGHPAFKVKNKSFVFMSFNERGINLCVKLTDSLFKALALPFVEPGGYGLGKSGWIAARLDSEDSLSEDILKTWIAESFANVAPKTLLKQLNQESVDQKPAAGAGKGAAKKTTMRKTPMGDTLVKVSVSKTRV
jgi:predicted DNA-binding protein (MmcQ/YjbR family)